MNDAWRNTGALHRALEEAARQNRDRYETIIQNVGLGDPYLKQIEIMHSLSAVERLRLSMEIPSSLNREIRLLHDRWKDHPPSGR